MRYDYYILNRNFIVTYYNIKVVQTIKLLLVEVGVYNLINNKPFDEGPEWITHYENVKIQC